MTRTTVITGAASGIGAATARRLRARGERVIGVDRAGSDISLDLGSADGRAALADRVSEAADGRVDALIACAGIWSPGTAAVRVNYFGCIATVLGLHPLLCASDAPRVVVTTSIATILPSDDDLVDACLADDEALAVELAEGYGDPDVPYYSAKRALSRWIRRTAVTPAWAGAGITLNAVGPGVVRTPMTEPVLATPAGREQANLVPQPLGGIGNADQIAAVLEWFVHPDNSFVTGQVLFADGGTDAVVRGDDIF